MFRLIWRLAVPMTAIALFALAPPTKAAVIDLTSGGSVTLAQLLAGVDVTVGDKLFYDFGGWATTSTGGALAVDPNLISVKRDPSEPAGELGLLFQTTQWFVFGTQTQDTKFEYNVASMSGRLISDITLQTAGGALYDGFWYVSENVTFSAGALNLDVTNPPPGPDLVVTLDHKVFPVPVSVAHVAKDIALNAGPLAVGSAGISAVEQDFSQVPTPQAAFAGFGLFGVLGALKLRRSLKA